MPHLSRTAEKLLRTIAAHDTGSGVAFEWLPRGRYRMTGSTYTVCRRTFFPLTGAGLVTDNGNDDAPVRITEAGRDYLATVNGGARV